MLSVNGKEQVSEQTILFYYGIVKDEQWNYHLGKMYGCVCVISKISMLTNVQS
jgi:hypothetical protein